MSFIRTLLIAGLILLYSQPAAAVDRRTPVVEAIAKAGPAVVNIRTEKVIKRRAASSLFGFNDPFFEEFFRGFSPPRTFKTQSLGSGVIIDPHGYVLTNAHVIEKASKIYVALPDSPKELEATLVGQTERLDIAVLKINSDRTFPHLAPGRSDDLLIGETVIAIGNPLGLGHSVTTGIVSAQRRRIPIADNFVGLLKISVGRPIFPMSWITPAIRMPSIISGGRPISVAMARARLVVRFWCPAV